MNDNVEKIADTVKCQNIQIHRDNTFPDTYIPDLIHNVQKRLALESPGNIFESVRVAKTGQFSS